MESPTIKKEDIVRTFLRKNILVNRAVLEKLKEPTVIERWHNALKEGQSPQDLLKEKDAKQTQSVTVQWDYKDPDKKREVKDFVQHFGARYKQIESMLRSRQELRNLMSIMRLKDKTERENVSIIGMILDKQETKNQNIILTVEDTTGVTKVLITKTKKEVYDFAKDTVLDEVVGITGTLGDGIIFANSLISPDIPFTELKRAATEGAMAVLSCIHVGSAQFEDEKFANFLKWTRGEYGTEEQKQLAKKLKYIFICGDVVDGVGIYPAQESELRLTDIKEQYEECARLLKQIPERITLIIGPGNHDACRIAEPQPKLPAEYAKPVLDLPNAVPVCNPCRVNVHSTEDFPGFNILMYHGYSFDDYGELVESIKNSGLHLSDRAPLIMRFLLQRRHLAPQHGTNLYIPDPRKDPLVIEQVPDLFVAGHIHKSGIINYRGVSIVAGSCFQGKTSFQEKVGHEPDPGAVPVVDLQTRKTTVLRF